MQTRKRRANRSKFDTVVEKMTELSNKKMDLFLQTQKSECPELRDFFMSICGTVEKFSQYDQAIVKKRIMDLVTDMQIEKLRVDNAQAHIATNVPTNGFYDSYLHSNYIHPPPPPPPPSQNSHTYSPSNYHITQL